MAVKYGKKVRELMVKEIELTLKGNKGFIFSAFEKVKASELDAFRKKIKKANTRHLVIKKRLSKVALDKLGLGEFKNSLTDKKNIALTVIKEDPVTVAKILADFSKENPNFIITSGYLEGMVLDKARIKALASLPGRQQLLAMVAGTMNAPITSFVGVLAGVLRKFCYAVVSIKEKKEKGE